MKTQSEYLTSKLLIVSFMDMVHIVSSNGIFVIQFFKKLNWPAGVGKSYNLVRSFVSWSQLNSPDHTWWVFYSPLLYTLLATTYPPSDPHLMKIPLTPTLSPNHCDLVPY